MDLLKQKAKRAPTSPGCYLWKDEDGKIIYVGKAKNLNKRIGSYLRPNNQSYKGYLLYHHLTDLDWIVTETEVEALLLENTLIKKHQPIFNVRLKDDKRYPYLVVSLGEMFPRVFVTRKTQIKSHKYYGPYTEVRNLRSTLDLIHKLFPIRKKPLKLPLNAPAEPCLNFHIGRCLAPCTGKISQEEYDKVVEQVQLFIEGKHIRLLDKLHGQMNIASEQLEFEKAARLRDTIQNIENLANKQSVSVVGGNFDVVGSAFDEYQIEISVLEFREGNLNAKKSFGFPRNSEFEAANSTDRKNELFHGELEEHIESFVREYYLPRKAPVTDIYLPCSFPSLKLFAEYFQKNWEHKVNMSAPKRGEKADLIRLATKNAAVELLERRGAGRAKRSAESLEELQHMLEMDRLPKRIECYDISHSQGSEPVASGVMFVNGEPNKSGYRRYKIKSFEKGAIDDPGMIFETLCRRLQHLINEEKPMPDLFVIDGGLTQLQKAVEAMELFEVTNVAVVGLAKRHEEIYFPYNNTPVQFDPESPGMLLLRRIRDEAHRFAVTFHRERRSKQSFNTGLKKIRGLSDSKRREVMRLLAQFESSADVRRADLIAIPGIGPTIADRILDELSGAAALKD